MDIKCERERFEVSFSKERFWSCAVEVAFHSLRMEVDVCAIVSQIRSRILRKHLFC